MSHFEPKAEDQNCTSLLELSMPHDDPYVYSPSFLISNPFSFKIIDPDEIDVQRSYRYTNKIEEIKANNPFCHFDLKIRKKKSCKTNSFKKFGHTQVS